MARNGTTPGTPDTLASRIADELRAQIASGSLEPGDRVPTLREMASDRDVHPSTVQQAYRRLADEGLLETRVGRGTVVRSPSAPPRTDRAVELERPGRSPSAPAPTFPEHETFSPAARAALEAVGNARSWSLPDPSRCEIDFASLHPEPSRFPVESLRSAIGAALDPGRTALGYGDPAGSSRLRSLLSERSGRGADEILVTSGAQQGIDLVVRALVAPGRAVAVAVPTYPQLFGLLATQGVRAVPLPSRDGVADLEGLRRVLSTDDIALLYVMPSFHNPTGATLDLDQRRRLMAALADTDIPVLEDEYESDLRFRGEAPPSLASLDPRGLTVTVRTVSKALFPGLRLGWLEAAPRLLEPMLALKQFSDIETSGFLQEVLALLLESGSLDEHLDRLRADLRSSHDLADRILTERAPDSVRWQSPDGGPTLWLECPELDTDEVARLASERGVAVFPDRVFDPEGLQSREPGSGAARSPAIRGLRISLARCSDESLREGLERLCVCLEEVQRAAHRRARTRPVIL